MGVVRDLKKMKMHETITINSYLTVARVPGGLLYTAAHRGVHSTFVPLFIGQAPALLDPLWLEKDQ